MMLRRAPEALCPLSCRSSCVLPVHSGYIVSVALPSRLSFAHLATDAIAAFSSISPFVHSEVSESSPSAPALRRASRE